MILEDFQQGRVGMKIKKYFSLALHAKMLLDNHNDGCIMTRYHENMSV